jgi:hypothetical protein
MLMMTGFLLIFVTAGVSVAAVEIPEDFQLTAQNEYLELYARPEDGQLIVRDRAGGVWYSNPDVSTIDGFMWLSDAWQGNLQSPIYLDYFDKRRNVRGANAYSKDVQIEYAEIDNGFAMRYYFENTGIGFTVEYTLADNSLTAYVPWEQVQIGNGDLQLLALRLLPFLGAQPSEADPSGYMVVPDGSGGLVWFKEQVSLSQTGYNQWIYGLDPASAEPTYDPYREPVVMPIFGMKTWDQAFLGIIEEGQESAKVIATPAGVITNLNWITAELWYSQSIIMRTSRQGGGIRIFDENPIPGDRRIRFYFLTDDQADYVGMAQTYREYLIAEQGAKRIDSKTWQAPLLVELLGADYETNIFGPVIKPVTTFEQAVEVVDQLLASGVDNLIINFRGWNRMGIHGNLPRRLPPEKELGGEEGLRSLVDQLHERGIRILLADDYTIARGSNNGFQPSTQASRTAFNDLIRMSSYGFAIGAPDVTTYLISPKISLEYAERDIPKIAQYGVDGLVHLSIGSALNSDHNPNIEAKIQRRDARLLYKQLIDLTREYVDTIGVTTGNAYLIGSIDFIQDIPLQTTQDSFIDQSIPFYQIAVHGLVTYYTDHLNLSINPTRDLLRAVEYGALPSFVLTAEPSWHLRYTLSSDMYSTYYLDWLDRTVEQYQKINLKLQQVHDQFIVDHRPLAADVFLTEYEDGTRFVVNYGTRPYDYSGTTVMGNSFAVFDKEGQIQ